MNRKEGAAYARRIRKEKLAEINRTISLRGEAHASMKKIQKQFLKDLFDFWCFNEEEVEDGEELPKYTRGMFTLRAAATKDPSAFVRMMAAMLPKDKDMTKKPKKTLHVETSETLALIREVDENERSKEEVIEVEDESGLIRDGSVESEEDRGVAEESPDSDQ